MKKEIIIYTLTLLCNIGLYSQNSDEKWFRNYFKDNLEKLDPIEGIYSVESIGYITYNGRTVEIKNSDEKIAIIKKEDSFMECMIQNDANIEGGDVQYKKFDRIGETTVYVCTWKWIDHSETANSRVYMDSLLGFKYTITVPTCVTKKIKKNCTVRTSFSYIKDYPTRSMYNASNTEKEVQPSSWSGSGWALGDGYVVTNNHVVEGASIIIVKGVGGDNNTGFTAEVVITDRINDIAILKIKDSQFKEYGNIPYCVSSRIADVGEDVFVLGWPLGQLLGEEIKLTTGSINSRTGFGDFQNCYQIQAPITNGNSGGPVFDSKGNIIGIVVGGLNKELNLAENVGYAIKTSYLKILIESAELNIPFPGNNTISTLSRPEKVKRVKNFVYYIECSK